MITILKNAVNSYRYLQYGVPEFIFYQASFLYREIKDNDFVAKDTIFQRGFLKRVICH